MKAQRYSRWICLWLFSWFWGYTLQADSTSTQEASNDQQVVGIETRQHEPAPLAIANEPEANVDSIEQSAIESPEEPQLIRIVCVGDSIVSRASQTAFPGQFGWGETISNFLSDDVEVINHAYGGRSTMSFINEGRWESAKADEPDFVFIEFGHNDQKINDPNRYTNPETTFRDFLRIYINESREIGAVPVLVTPVARRIFSQKGKISRSLSPYAQAMRIVADELDVALVDMFTLSVNYYEFLGPETAEQYHPITLGGTFDLTHLNTLASNWVSRTIMSNILWLDRSDLLPVQENVTFEIPRHDIDVPESDDVQIQVSSDLLNWGDWSEPFSHDGGALRFAPWIEHSSSAFVRVEYAPQN